MKRALVSCLLLLFPTALAPAQATPVPVAEQAPAPGSGQDPIAQNLFPPDLVMRHGSEIGLDEKQRAAIKDVVQKAQAKFLDFQWDMQAESEKMIRLLQAKPIDETAALAQVEKVLTLEREVKKAQLTLLIRIKNLLTEPQQVRLTELRKKTD
jgi:Spy/CpxP family protein refolding chaperone